MVNYADVRLVCPVKSPIITQGFGLNPDVYKKWGYAGHNGIDYYSQDYYIYQAHDGVVNQVGWDPTGYGNYIVVEAYSPSGYIYETLYAHLSEVRVRVGQNVSAGDIIGVMGTTGFSSGIHLHFELRLLKNPRAGYAKGQVDPQPYYVAVIPMPSTPPVPTVSKGTAIVNAGTDGLSVRFGPGKEYDRLAVLSTGTEVEIISMEGDWAAIKFYCHGGYLIEKAKDDTNR